MEEEQAREQKYTTGARSPGRYLLSSGGINSRDRGERESVEVLPETRPSRQNNRTPTTKTRQRVAKRHLPATITPELLPPVRVDSVFGMRKPIPGKADENEKKERQLECCSDHVE